MNVEDYYLHLFEFRVLDKKHKPVVKDKTQSIFAGIEDSAEFSDIDARADKISEIDKLAAKISDAAICEFALYAFDCPINTEGISLETLLDEYTKNLTYSQNSQIPTTFTNPFLSSHKH